jgi:GLPGLI family protein
MKTLAATLVIFIFAANILLAQNARFITSGTIDYEKSVNMYALIKKMYVDNMEEYYQKALDDYKKSHPQFKVLRSKLTFNSDKTLFTPIAPDTVASGWFTLPMTDQNNIVYTDLRAHATTAQKNVFDQTFLVKDSLRKIKWKITGETRDILGFSCRRANGLILDSVYLVAFFAEKIPVSGGPESFSGLLGMILELALPHENMIWRATKIIDTTVPATTIAPPKKGKVINNKQLYDTLRGIFKNYGHSAQLNFVMRQYMF